MQLLSNNRRASKMIVAEIQHRKICTKTHILSDFFLPVKLPPSPDSRVFATHDECGLRSPAVQL